MTDDEPAADPEATGGLAFSIVFFGGFLLGAWVLSAFGVWWPLAGAGAVFVGGVPGIFVRAAVEVWLEE